MMVAAAASAADFRCDTELFVAGNKQPVQQTQTLFTNSLAYDFLLGKDAEQDQEITIYDFGRGEVQLLDNTRRLKTKILEGQLLQWAAAYKINKPESALFKFCIEPVFKETFAEKTLTLFATQLKYQVTCITPEADGAAANYRQFADWSARLNSMRPGNLPPFPRMELNKALAGHSMLPEEIERTITTTHLTGRRSETVRSRHNFNWAVSGQDQKRIEEVGNLLGKYRAVEADEYLGLVKKTAGK
jgi:hypothetical protein